MELHQRTEDVRTVLVIGANEVGKSKWIESATTIILTPRGDSDFHTADVQGPLWDTTLLFCENFRVYSLTAHLYAFIFNINDMRTLIDHMDHVTDAIHVGDIDKLGAVLLVANKCDLVDEHNAAAVEETRRVARRLAEEGGFIYVETSATTGEGMAEALYLLLNKECRVPMDEAGMALEELGAVSRTDELWCKNHHTPLPL